MRPWEIVLIVFPFTDLTSVKVRPALVVSSESQMRQSEDAIFMLISSQLNGVRPTDFVIQETHAEFPMTGLKKSSVFRSDKIHCLQKRLARKRLGSIGPIVQREIINRLEAVLAI